MLGRTDRLPHPFLNLELVSAADGPERFGVGMEQAGEAA